MKTIIFSLSFIPLLLCSCGFGIDGVYYEYYDYSRENNTEPISAQRFNTSYHSFIDGNVKLTYFFNMANTISNFSTSGTSNCTFDFSRFNNIEYVNLFYELTLEEESLFIEFDESNNESFNHIKEEIFFIRAKDGSYYWDSSLGVAKEYINDYNSKLIKLENNIGYYENNYCSVVINSSLRMERVKIESYGLPLTEFQFNFDRTQLFFKCKQKAINGIASVRIFAYYDRTMNSQTKSDFLELFYLNNTYNISSNESRQVITSFRSFDA